MILPQKNEVMDCVICKNGTTEPGKVTVTLERGSSLIAIKEVPADVCNNCGEYYLSAEMTKEVLKRQKKHSVKALK